ncbi:MAG: hypothetical protein AAFV43_05220 [Planctomycetota bacterium]
MRLLLVIVLIATSVTASADYLFNTFNTVVRYSDAGERLFAYGCEGPNGCWLGESADTVTVDAEGVVYTSVNNLGNRSLLQFDFETGERLSGPELGAQDIRVEGDWWQSSFREPEMDCGPNGCTPFWLPTQQAVEYATGRVWLSARLRDGLIAHPDGHVYGVGVADAWRSPTPRFGEYVDTFAALLRFPQDFTSAPQVVSVISTDTSLVEFTYQYADVELGPDGAVYFGTDEGIAVVQPAEFTGFATVSAVPTISPPIPPASFTVGEGGELYSVSLLRGAPTEPPGVFLLRTNPATGQAEAAVDLRPFLAERDSARFGDVFLDDTGGVLVPLSYRDTGVASEFEAAYRAQLLRFDANTGEFDRMVFDEPLDNLEVFLTGGVYVRVIPEPGAAFALVLAAMLVPRRLNHAHR